MFVLFSLMVAQALLADDIGNIFELKGNAKVIRDKDYNAELKFGIQSLDDVRTSNGRLAIRFEDDSTVKLTEHSKLIIDEYIYDPNPSKSKLALKFASGTARFVTGKLASIDKENIFIKTPTADISIRGTDFTATVDELGRSLIILLPDENGLPSGEIVVTTLGGSVTLNRPYQATTTTVFEQSPTSPVILDLTLDDINNLLIISPPEENEELVTREEQSSGTTNLLYFDELDIDYLDQNFLDKDELEFTELDIDYLNTNFFEDLLAIIEDLDKLDQDNLVSTLDSAIVQGTAIGQDLQTQITTIIAGDVISLMRSVQQTVHLDLDSQEGYTVLLIQDGISNQIIINGGGSSTIRIYQSSG